jgi:hypothetical protein
MAWKILTEVSNFRNLSLDHATGVEESVSQSVIATRTNERRRKTQTPLFDKKLKLPLSVWQSWYIQVIRDSFLISLL